MKPPAIIETLRSRKLFSSRYFPVVLFAVLVIILLISTRLSGRIPHVEFISPSVASPGEILLIRGRDFGRKSAGSVSIAGINPTSSSFLEWNETRIAVRIPEDIGYGLVYVTNEYGRSNGVLFTNRMYIPEIVSGPARPGFPYIGSLDPGRGSPGSLVTVHGMNFGVNRAESSVHFAWVPSETSGKADSNDKAGFLPCSENDFDYEYWSDREIRVRVPSGAVSGSLYIRTAQGDSNTTFFEVVEDVGTRLYHNKKTYAIQNQLDILSVAAEPGNGLYLWVPHVLESSSQREVQVVNREPVPMIENYQGSSLYFLNDLVTGTDYRITQSYLVDRYTEENRIRPADIKKYNTSRKLYVEYTKADSIIPSDSEEVKKAVRTVLGKEKNPYIQARGIYDYLLKTLSYRKTAPERNVLIALHEQSSTPYEYAVLMTAFLRSAGIPSRTVSGYLIGDNLSSISHTWAEFYLEDYGWVPVDPCLGDEPSISRFTVHPDAASFYFGSLDNRHIELARGLRILKQMDPRGAIVRKERPFGFQSFHEEAVGNLKRYSSVWGDLVIQGIY